MHCRTKLTWIAVVTVWALSAEQAAVAQSAPPAPPATARTDQGSSSARPQLVATRGTTTTKRSNTGAPVDLNSLASREAAASSAGPATLALPSAGAPIQSAAGADTLQALHGDATGSAQTNAGVASHVALDAAERASLGARAGRPEAVIRGQINPAARACYENADAKSKQPGRLAILIKLTPTGDVEAVNVSSNEGVSESVVTCITTAAQAATFAAPGPNGASVRAAFAFPPTGARAKAVQGPTHR
jgi:hypothetical protein